MKKINPQLPHITIEHLRAFQALVTTGTSHRADEFLKLPLGTASHRVSELEEILGITLITGRKRSKNPVTLTTYGRHVFAETVHILTRVDYVRAFASECAKEAAA